MIISRAQNLINLDLSSNDINDRIFELKSKLPKLKHLNFLNISNCKKLVETLCYLAENIQNNLKIKCKKCNKLRMIKN